MSIGTEDFANTDILRIQCYTTWRKYGKNSTNAHPVATYDDALSMYSMSASLRGNLSILGELLLSLLGGSNENQSVWLHMFYKFYLDLLRHTLNENF